MENLNISDVSPFGFRVSWTARHGNQPGGFDHFHLVVTDSGWLLEPQEFTVTGNQTSLDIRGLITGIGYEVQLTGVTKSGLWSRPLTTVAVTGTIIPDKQRALHQRTGTLERGPGHRGLS